MSREFIVTERESELGTVRQGLCFIFTENRFNEVLMFKNQFDAIDWCKHATRWSDDEIRKNIVFPQGGTKLFSCIFPQNVATQ